MTSIKYGFLKIEQLTTSSGLFIGTNIHKGRKSQTSINEGFGTIKGKQNKIRDNTAMIKKNLKRN
ncbi:hypothetical protein D8M04_17065 [Oceanobacillus piezotolerans]|uniref:Uncharacterized protein n=1 Tax=Oceanobacillus piezotolerans TaxID=2448030 RepID=A0A498DAE6_9BACI|nr:hypothetical protein [Oceanobacillus piezotolerans]RLL41778.1 hypothetical protein D8M04_17065 [Oceanobacillus piezotolerans]